MLILTRRPQEAIRVGSEVTITVLGVEGGKVRIGITAPRHIAIDRQEIYDRKHREETAPSALQAPSPQPPAPTSSDAPPSLSPRDRTR